VRELPREEEWLGYDSLLAAHIPAEPIPGMWLLSGDKWLCVPLGLAWLEGQRSVTPFIRRARRNREGK
jgi:hypothetical protein